MKRSLMFAVLMLLGITGFGFDEVRPAAPSDAATPKKIVTLDAHGTKNLVLRCGDYRYRPHIEKWIDEKLGNADEHVWPGCTVGITNPKIQLATLEAIQTYQRLHGITTIHLFAHRDCGGHGGSKKHASPEAERRYHLSDLLGAQRVIHGAFPKLTVKIYYVQLDAAGDFHWEELALDDPNEKS